MTKRKLPDRGKAFTGAARQLSTANALHPADAPASSSETEQSDFNPPAGAQHCSHFDTHRILRPMRRCVDSAFEAGDYERAFPLLHAVILLNNKPSFLRGSVHQHFEPDGES